MRRGVRALHLGQVRRSKFNTLSKGYNPGCLGESIQRKLPPTHVREREAIRVFHHERVGRGVGRPKSTLVNHVSGVQQGCNRIQRNRLNSWVGDAWRRGGWWLHSVLIVQQDATNERELTAIGGRQRLSAAVNRLNFGGGAERVDGHHIGQNGIENRVGLTQRVRVYGHGYAIEQPSPQLGSGEIGTLNRIGAEIRARQIRTRVAGEQPLEEQIAAVISPKQDLRLLAMDGQIPRLKDPEVRVRPG